MTMTSERDAVVEHDEEHAHPGPRKYVMIAVILAVFTTVEIILSYSNLERWITTALMVGLAIVKFSMVARFFMHLRFDNRIFTMFMTGPARYTWNRIHLLFDRNSSGAPVR